MRYSPISAPLLPWTMITSISGPPSARPILHVPPCSRDARWPGVHQFCEHCQVLGHLIVSFDTSGNCGPRLVTCVSGAIVWSDARFLCQHWQICRPDFRFLCEHCQLFDPKRIPWQVLGPVIVSLVITYHWKLPAPMNPMIITFESAGNCLVPCSFLLGALVSTAHFF